MLRYIKEKTSSFMFTLRFSILFIFASLFIITVVTLVTIFYYHIDEVVERAAFLMMERVSYSVLQELDSELEPPKSASQLTANLIQGKVLDPNNQKELLGFLTDLLDKLPLSQGLHWADTAGNFYYAYREENGNTTFEIIDRRVPNPVSTYIYQNNLHKEMKRVSSPVDYEARLRPWFQEALKAKKTIWTAVGPSGHKPSYLVINVATPVFHDDGTPWGVFAVDIRLDYLSRFLARQRLIDHTEIMIIDKNGNIIVSPDLIKSELTPVAVNKPVFLTNLAAISKPWFVKAFDYYKRTSLSIFPFTYHGVPYLATFKKIPVMTGHDWRIALVTPAAEFTHEIHHIELAYIFIFLTIFITGMILMSNLVARIITPIKKLVRETKKIKNFDLEGAGRVFSRLTEVIELSDSIYGMKMGLRSFQKYVPAGLVRQLIATDEDARIGGTKRDLVIFFSDIMNFTSITEKVETNELVKQVCEYFEIFTRAISENQGTIDKYIGDSIMAFWNAPLPVQDPCIHAARAALYCMDQSQVLNDLWEKQKKPVFLTRIGIHYGEAIVGNIGSSERLNYTALGDSVNIASRLIGANKIYGTSILVSETVYQKLKDLFVLRLVDTVVFKGKAESISIYELLATSKKRILFDIDSYTQNFNQAFSAYQQGKWIEAIEFFNLCLQIYPEDKLAVIFIKRSERFNRVHPGQTWNGIWHISEK